MSLSHAILVCLVQEPMTGYQLAKRFDSSVGFFWRATHQQIYRELGTLGDKGFVKGKRVAQTSKPNKTVFTVTKAGKTELRAWSQVATDPAAIKEELLLKFYALESADLPALHEQVQDRLLTHKERLQIYENILAQHYSDEAALDLAASGRLLGLKAGISVERSWIEWCHDALKTLQRHAVR